MTDSELDEIMIFHWPRVLRQVMADSSDEWLQGFVRSIARHGKRPTWRPTFKQQQIMRRLVREMGTGANGNGEVIEGGDSAA